MDKFKNKYRIQSHRKPNWDYSADGVYFITFVTQGRICNLGRIENGEMILSDFGEIVQTQWFKSFELRSELFLDEFIIMPNHVHAIVFIDNVANDVETHGVETHGRASLPVESPIRLPKSISSFLAGFKSAVNTKIDDFIDDNKLDLVKYNRNNHFFQPNYHDHIIRNEQEYLRIKNYIINNPMNWKGDLFHE